MVDSTSGLIPVNTGFNLEVLPCLNTCIWRNQTFATYFVFLECLIKNKCRLMIQNLSCRNYLCPL